jgi:hypothetical protein
MAGIATQLERAHHGHRERLAFDPESEQIDAERDQRRGRACLRQQFERLVRNGMQPQSGQAPEEAEAEREHDRIARDLAHSPQDQEWRASRKTSARPMPSARYRTAKAAAC